MQAAPTEEQHELRNVVRALCEKESPESVVRATMESERGYNPALWSRLADELGLIGLAVPEEFGGAGAGWAEQGVVFEELGRALVCVPYFSVVALAIPALLAADDLDAARRWLPAITEGRTLATAALTGGIRRTAADVPVTAEWNGSGWRLTGRESTVVDSAVAELLLVLGRTDDTVSLFAVTAGADGVAVDEPRTSDRTRRIGGLTLAGAAATLVGRSGAGLEIAARVAARAAAALACEQVGGAARALELSVEYARTRVQFGRPIGSFQAVQHRCADMLVAVETARSAAWAAVHAADADAADLALVASIAHAVCSDAYSRCASDCVQVHGGIGYTWEHPAHLHVKRSRGSAVLLGTPHEHRRIVAGLVPLGGSPGEKGRSQ
jgi:acyl-CoA dehydrogenase